MTVSNIPPLASAFPPADEAQWRALVDKVLKGGSFERLVGRTYDGIAIKPLYPRARAAGARAIGATRGGWEILARVDDPDSARANAQARADLADGASGLHLVFAGSPGSYGFGLAGDALAQTLEGIDPAGLAIEIDLSDAAKGAPEILADLIVASGLNPASAQVSFGYDPIGDAARNGGAPTQWSAIAPAFAAKIAALRARGFTGPFCAADGRIVHAAGGSEALELAYVLSCALAYLRALEATGIALETARTMIGLRLCADADQFLTIAKFRAMRRLWARVEEACGLAAEPICIHAETAWRMMTRRDPWVNLLRGTIATFSAATGGADRISVLPFTQALGLPDAFARRLARNTQLILLEEANIARVADPAAGSGGIETLTEELAGAAWTQFQAFEREGGVGQASVRAALAGKIADVCAARARNIATRRDPLTGVSEFPNLQEAPVGVLAPFAETVDTHAEASLRPMRVAAPFEMLRRRAERMQRPRVFLANIGSLAAFNARATFARNFFEAGGLEAVTNDGFTDPARAGEAFAASSARLACICSSDAIYGEHAAAFARQLKQAGARAIWLAGRPGDLESALRAAGVDGFVYAGCDAIAALEAALSRAE